MRPPQKLLDALLLIWGLLWLGVGALMGILFLLTAAVASSGWHLSLGMMVPIFAGLVGGGVGDPFFVALDVRLATLAPSLAAGLGAGWRVRAGPCR